MVTESEQKQLRQSLAEFDRVMTGSKESAKSLLNNVPSYDDWRNSVRNNISTIANKQYNPPVSSPILSGNGDNMLINNLQERNALITFFYQQPEFKELQEKFKNEVYITFGKRYFLNGYNSKKYSFLPYQLNSGRWGLLIHNQGKFTYLAPVLWTDGNIQNNDLAEINTYLAPFNQVAVISSGSGVTMNSQDSALTSLAYLQTTLGVLGQWGNLDPNSNYMWMLQNSYSTMRDRKAEYQQLIQEEVLQAQILQQ